MKITYLAYTQQPDKSTRLSVVSYDEWKQIVQENRVLPAEKRRYFITDCFQDTDTLDCMVIETLYEENQGFEGFWRNIEIMIKVLFICHGNICRSPMARFIMEDLVKKAGLEERIKVDSAATSTEEIGNPVYPPARRKLAEYGIGCQGHAAKQMKKADYSDYDLLIGMDQANLRNMTRICGGDPEGKIHLLMDYTDRPGQVADPWYTGDFETMYQDVLEGCQGLLEELKKGL